MRKLSVGTGVLLVISIKVDFKPQIAVKHLTKHQDIEAGTPATRSKIEIKRKERLMLLVEEFLWLMKREVLQLVHSYR